MKNWSMGGGGGELKVFLDFGYSYIRSKRTGIIIVQKCYLHVPEVFL